MQSTHATNSTYVNIMTAAAFIPLAANHTSGYINNTYMESGHNFLMPLRNPPISRIPISEDKNYF